MKLVLKNYEQELVVHREVGDPSFRTESTFLYHVRKALPGIDLVKKLMWKDGHMVDDSQHYLRTRNANCACPHVYLYSAQWALHGLHEDFNRGEVIISIMPDIFDVQPDCMARLEEILHG